MEKNIVSIYTDGSANYKTGFGAWAFIVVEGNKAIEKRAHAYEGITNNKMELMAILEALDFILRREDPNEDQRVIPSPEYRVISDSQYCVNGINQWRFAWKQKNWKNVKNIPLWLAIDTALGAISDLGLTVVVSWVRGHDGNNFNEQCDKLANEEYKKFSLARCKQL